MTPSGHGSCVCEPPLQHHLLLTLPLQVRYAGTKVLEPSKDEEQIAEAIEIDDNVLRDRGGLSQGDDEAFRAPANCAGHMQLSRRNTPAGEDEVLERGQFPLAKVNHLLEPLDMGSLDSTVVSSLGRGGGQFRSHHEQLALHVGENLIDAGRRVGGAGNPEGSVQFVDGAVSFDARVMLLDANPAQEPCFTGVAGPSVDFHGLCLV